MARNQGFKKTLSELSARGFSASHTTQPIKSLGEEFKMAQDKKPKLSFRTRKVAMTENTNRPPEAQDNEAPLESWKEIATYLNRTVRTVKRWETEEALPVRRHLHQARSSVYAYTSELEAWKAARAPGVNQAVAVMPWRRPLPALGFALTLLLALLSVASGPILTPPGALAQESGGMTTRRVWTVPGANLPVMPTADGRSHWRE